MGNLNYLRGEYADDKARTIASTRYAQSGAFTSSGTAANIAGLDLKAGDVVRFDATTSHWINFGGNTAAVGTGHHVPEGGTLTLEVDETHVGLPVSAIEG